MAQTNPKLTKGEKCIFIHLFITFLIILIMIIIFFFHLFFVKHDGNEMFRVYRRSYNNKEFFKSKERDTYSVGTLYSNVTRKIICHTLLLRAQWSVAPAHCIIIHSDPDMAYLLNSWTIKYIYNYNQIIETYMKRNVVHAQFDRNGFKNNIGLIEHTIPIALTEYFVPYKFNDQGKVLRENTGSTEIVGWDFSRTTRGDSLIKKIYTSTVMSKEKCKNIISPIMDNLREYELCVTLTRDYNESILYHGAILSSKSETIGFFSWGDKRGRGVPYIILNIEYFKHWMENIMTI